ncbi:hypothetical protein HY572_05465 [Candidatus Micrarchaeota archaeon]|nr:hypothetical protein [Candidatus Micrarchaeota archaeon]
MDFNALGPLFFWAKIVVPLGLILFGIYAALSDALLGAGIALSSALAFLILDVLQFKTHHG